MQQQQQQCGTRDLPVSSTHTSSSTGKDSGDTTEEDEAAGEAMGGAHSKQSACSVTGGNGGGRPQVTRSAILLDNAKALLEDGIKAIKTDELLPQSRSLEEGGGGEAAVAADSGNVPLSKRAKRRRQKKRDKRDKLNSSAPPEVSAVVASPGSCSTGVNPSQENKERRSDPSWLDKMVKFAEVNFTIVSSATDDAETCHRRAHCVRNGHRRCG